MENRIEQLKQLIDRVGLTHYGKSLRRSNHELLDWIMQETGDLPDDISLGERVYLVLNGRDDMTCQYGEKKIFNTLNKGYRFCAPDCRCRREEQSRKITAFEKGLAPDVHKRRLEKRKATLMTNHGVENAMHIPAAKAKLEATNLERLGVRYPASSPDVQEKIRQTQLERHGCHPCSTDAVKTKIKQTNLERYGTENVMHIARAAFAEQIGIDNPFKLAEYQDKATQTRIAKYGAKTPLENADILAKMIADTEAKYGVKSVLLLPENMARSDAPSKIGTSWLDSLNVPVREHVIEFGTTYVRVDGFDPETNTVYLFHGDFWHGNPASFSPDEVNAKNGKTFRELYEHTLTVEQMIQAAGYNLVVMWEKDWKRARRRSRAECADPTRILTFDSEIDKKIVYGTPSEND